MPRALDRRLPAVVSCLDERPARADVAGREQARQRHEQQVGPPIDVDTRQHRQRAWRQRACRREVVVVERPAGCDVEELRGAPGSRSVSSSTCRARCGTGGPARSGKRSSSRARRSRSTRWRRSTRHVPVQIGPRRLEQPPVRRVVDEHVVEAVEWLVTPVRAGRLDELLAAEALQHRRQGELVTTERVQRADAELGADHRRELEHPSSSTRNRSTWVASSDWIVGGTSTASASMVRSQAPSSRRWITPSSTSMRTSSRTNSGLPSVDAGDGRRARRGARCRAGRPRAPRSHSSRARRGRRHRRPAAGLDERGPQVPDLGTGESHQQHGIGHPLGEVVDQVEQDRLGPLDVVDHHEQGELGRERLQRARTAQNVSSTERGRHRAAASVSTTVRSVAVVTDERTEALMGDRCLVALGVPERRGPRAGGRQRARRWSRPSGRTGFSRRGAPGRGDPTRSLCDRRVLPRPGEPTTVASRAASAAGASNAATSRASSAVPPDERRGRSRPLLGRGRDRVGADGLRDA